MGVLVHKILFVCYGNICRSPMAEFVMKDLVDKHGEANKFFIRSAATAYDEIGNGVYYGTRKILDRLGINYSGKVAVKLVRDDYNKYDYIIGMDDMNVRDMLRIFGGDPDGKIYKFLDFTDRHGNVADPWYTGDFESTYKDVKEGTEGLYKVISAD